MPRGNDLTPSIDAVTEEVGIGWDFGNAMDSMVEIDQIVSTTSAVAESSRVDDPQASTRLIGNPGLVPSVVSGVPSQAVAQLFGTAIEGVTYLLTAVVHTTDGQTLSCWCHYTCEEPN